MSKKIIVLLILLISILSYSFGQDKYIGEYKDGKYSGYGTYIFSSGDKYIGEWANGRFNGIGTLFYRDGTKKTGIWKDNNFTEEFVVNPPWHLIDVWYQIDTTIEFQDFSLDFDIKQNVSDNHLLYISPFGYGKINNTVFYGGIQTKSGGFKDKNHIKNKSPKSEIGRGVIFSRFSNRNPQSMELAEGGFCESGDYEGDFFSVRNKFGWSKGKYNIRIFKTNKSVLIKGVTHIFVGMEITSYTDKKTQIAGYLAFPGKTLKLDKDLAIFVEIYGGKTLISQTPKNTIEFYNLRLNGALQTPKSITSYYPNNFPQWANSRWDMNKLVVDFGEQQDRTNYGRGQDNYYKKLK